MWDGDGISNIYDSLSTRGVVLSVLHNYICDIWRRHVSSYGGILVVLVVEVDIVVGCTPNFVDWYYYPCVISYHILFLGCHLSCVITYMLSLLMQLFRSCPFLSSNVGQSF